MATTKFILEANDLGGDTIRPGDDLLLRFTVVEWEEKLTPAKAGEEDFIAVMDKRLLDEAREYCNNAAGINDWTKFNDDTMVTDAVAYTWGGTDDVAAFNSKLRDQQSATTAYFAYGQNTTIAPNPNPANHRDWSHWNNTTAPDADWDNYLFTGNVDNDTTYNQLTIGGIDYSPYRPGFSTYRYVNGGTVTNPVGGDVNPYDWHHVLYSAGVDCSGFVQRAASYNGNNYVLNDFFGTDEWSTNTMGFPVHARHGTGGIADDARSWLINDRNLMVPGDILIRTGSNGHVAIVYRIDYENNSREIEDQSPHVYVIEATRGEFDEWQVLNTNTWEDLGDGYDIRRLRTNN